MAVPKLRFKADDGSDYPEWNDFTKLEDISAFITKGATPTTYGFDWQPNGVYFFRNDCIKNNVFVYGDYSFIAEEANKFLQRSEVTGGDIVIAITGDIGKVGLIPSEVKKANINQHLARVRIVKDAFPYFVYMYLCSDKVQRTYKKIKTGLSMPQLSLAQIRDTNIPVVSLPEQQKIAEFLSTIDTVIEKQKETVSAWEERKKGVMQKLFSQEVRFKADDGSDFPDWEEKKLGKVFTERTERSKGGESLLSVTIAQGIVKQSETDKRNIASENKSNYKIVKKNDLAYNTMRMWQGAEGVSEYDGIVSPAYTVITVLDGKNSYFFETMFKQTFMLQMFQRFSQGLTSDTWNLKFPAFSEIKCLIPCEDEQNKIVECVAVLDEVIEKQKATLAAWEELKKGLLQQMFM